MEQKNPYVGLLELMGSAANNAKTVACIMGTVLKTAPLTIRVGGLDIDADAIMMNPILRSNYKRRTSFSGTEDDMTYVSDELGKGDMVLLIPSADMQTFCLVCRLVAADG